MGRPPCCDKVGIKKGPWTPEEDIILVSYIQEHGPGNWRSVPTNTGLLRCSKSCRLRWTNYLRPGIKRGNFTPHEEGMIIHLQALLGNKWAAIASYLPQRTDNDIKNYWNTHLKKKLKKFHSSLEPQMPPNTTSTSSQFLPTSLNDKKSLDFTNQTSALLLNQTSTYASSTENISRLLEGWMRSSPKPTSHSQDLKLQQNNTDNSTSDGLASVYRAKEEQQSGGELSIYHEEFESILSFDQNLNTVSWDHNKSSSDESCATKGCSSSANDDKVQKQRSAENNAPPLSFLEKWLLDDQATAHVEEMNQIMELPPIF